MDTRIQLCTHDAVFKLVFAAHVWLERNTRIFCSVQMLMEDVLGLVVRLTDVRACLSTWRKVKRCARIKLQGFVMWISSLFLSLLSRRLFSVVM